MSSFFDEIERDLTDAAARRRFRGPRRSRTAAFAVAAALTMSAGGTAAAATYYVLRASPIAPFAAADLTPEQAVAVGTSRVLDLRSADPSRGEPPWALRLARSRAGLLCGTVGQVDAGAFGLVGLDDRFRELPEANADACGDDVTGDATLLGLRVFDADRVEDVRTVFNGVARGLKDVRVRTRNQPPRRVLHSSEGGFVLALPGYPEDLQLRVELRFADGTVRRHAFAVDPFVVPDPLGSVAWRVEAFTFGVPSRPGRPRRPPAYQTGCVRFASARPGTNLPRPSAPAVCGREPGRPGGPDGTLYFTSRRLGGDTESRDVMTTGDWNRHPPRTAVYGNARGARELTVTAPGIRRTVRPTMNGAFLLVFGPDMRPSTIRVKVRMRDGSTRTLGSRHGVVPPPS